MKQFLSSMGQEKTAHVVPLGGRNVFIIVLLGIAGQIAWAVENSWFNTFVFDEITESPRPIAWMVAISAITATLTTIFMGSLSDRIGRRKPFIVLGYVIWGLVTAVYPASELVGDLTLAIFLVIFLDAIMTFFGSTANDAAFNAWVTDIGHSSNRNRVKMLLEVSTLVANIVALGLAGIIIDYYGYFVFFSVLGGFVTFSGLLVSFFLHEPVGQVPTVEETYKEQILSILDPSVVRDNRTLYLLFLYMAMSGIALQVYFPYLFIFIENYIGMSKAELSIYAGIMLIGLIFVVLLIGQVSHRYNRKTLILMGTICGAFIVIGSGLIYPSIRDNPSRYYLIFVIYFLGQIPLTAANIAHGGWLQDRYPGEAIGKFQGVRMIFFVAIPMIIGPWIGSFTIENFGIPTTDGYIPTPEIFIVSGILTLLASLPIFFIPQQEGDIAFAGEVEI